jgi:Carboxypeptidase regulatory-like domain
MNWRRAVSSRFVVVPAVIVVTVVAWNFYVAQHDHGVLQGQVVDAAGHPVGGATVILFAHDFVTQVEKARTHTDAAGGFRFDNNDSHLVQLQAQDGGATSPRITIRLWFRAQDRVLGAPLRLGPAA